MSMERIPFDVFFFGVKEKIPLYLVNLLNPYQGDFYKCGNTYFQIDFPQTDHMFIVMAIGSDPSLAANMKDVILNAKINKVSFLTTENNKAISSICRFYGFKLVSREKGFFSNGEDALMYEILVKDYLSSKRHEK